MNDSDSTMDAPELPDGVTARLAPVAAMAALMWALEAIDLLPGISLDSWGIEPRRIDGLVGVVAAPFLHRDLAHLIGNTIPFLVLGGAIALGGARRWLEVTAIVMLCAGLGTWVIGSAGTVHLGASGVVFGYLTYLIGRGFIARHIGWIIGGIVVAMFYGGLLWGLLPRPGVSFTGHLFGAIGGLVAAWLLHGDDDEL